MINKYIRKNKKSKSTHKNKRHKNKKSIKNRIQGGFNPKNPTPELPPRKYLEKSVVNTTNNISAMNPTIQRVLLGIQNKKNSNTKHVNNPLYTSSYSMNNANPNHFSPNNTNFLRYSNNPLYEISSSEYEEVL
jgi:hypothetical protein